MKLKSAINIIVLYFLLHSYIHAQTNMYVRPYQGQQSTYLLSSVKSITFGSGNVYVNTYSPNTYPYVIPLVRYINFTDLTASVLPENLMQDISFKLFPNPAHQYIYIELSYFSDSGINLIISNITGKVFKSVFIDKTSDIIKISVAGLASGVYLCTLYNEKINQSRKFIKY